MNDCIWRSSSQYEGDRISIIFRASSVRKRGGTQFHGEGAAADVFIVCIAISTLHGSRRTSASALLLLTSYSFTSLRPIINLHFLHRSQEQ